MRKLKQINLSGRDLTPELRAQGFEEPDDKDLVKEIVSISTPVNPTEVKSKARILAFIARDSLAETVLVGGARPLVCALELHLKNLGIHSCRRTE